MKIIYLSLSATAAWMTGFIIALLAAVNYGG